MILERLSRVLSPPVFPDDEDRSRTATVLNTLLWNLLAVLVLAGAIGVPFVFAARVESIVTLVALLAVVIVSRSLMFRGKVDAASAVLVVTIWIALGVLTGLSGGIFSVNLILLMAWSVVAGLLLGRGWAIGTAAASSIFALAMALLEVFELPPPKPFPSPPLSRWVELTFGMCLAIIPLNMALRSLALALARARHELAVRLEAEEALRRSEERFRTIYDSVNEAVFLHDAATGAILDVNRKTVEMYGWGREEFLTLDTRDACSGEPGYSAADAASWLQRASKGESLSFLWHARRRDRTLFWCEVSMRPARIGGQELILVTVRDVDDRVRAEAEHLRLTEQLRQAQKLESIGRLAGGVAHDVNNLLTGILGSLELATMDLPADSRARAPVADARRAGLRAAELTSQLLTFSRKQILEPQTLDLAEVIASLRTMLSRLLGENIQLVTPCAPAVGAVRADRTQMENVIVNLAVNSKDAMPDGGRLELSLDEVEVDETEGAAPGRYVRLSVTDWGTGMSPEVMENIFEPFFTTKPRGKGTGLGLAMVFGAIKQHGGFIKVRSAPGQGTTFELHLPRISAHKPQPETTPGSTELARGKESLVLVEDELAVRDVVAATLKLLGYRIRVFASGEDAIAALPSIGEIDLLITDVILPGINGSVLAERFRERWPSLRVLFTSGYTDDAIAQHGVLQEGVRYLAKPFGPQSLAAKVRAVLDEG